MKGTLAISCPGLNMNFFSSLRYFSKRELRSTSSCRCLTVLSAT